MCSSVNNRQSNRTALSSFSLKIRHVLPVAHWYQRSARAQAPDTGPLYSLRMNLMLTLLEQLDYSIIANKVVYNYKLAVSSTS